MLGSTDDLAVFRARRDETVAELEAALAELPAARDKVAKLKDEALAAGRKFNQVASMVVQAVRPADGGVTPPALVRIVEEERKARDAVDAKLTVAKQELANIEWAVECLKADIAGLESVISPAPPGGRLPEIVRRTPPGPEHVELITMPPGHPATGEAA